MRTPEKGCLRKEGSMDIISAKEVLLKKFLKKTHSMY